MKQFRALIDSQCLQSRMRQAKSHQAVKKALPDLFKDDQDKPNMSLGKK